MQDATDENVRVRVATGQTTKPKYSTQLTLHPKLSAAAQKAYILDDLQAGTLLSLGQLCDDDCLALFTKYDVTIIKHGQVLIRGHRKPNGLWAAGPTITHGESKKDQPSHNRADPVRDHPPHQANGTLHDTGTKRQLAEYLHACAFSPVISTWTRAIKKGHFASWPGLTTELIQKHLQPSLSTSLGQMKSKRRKSSKRPVEQTQDQDPLLPDFEPTREEQTLDLYTTIWDTSKKTYSDQTGKFPVESTRGNKYIFVLYSYDANAILVEPLKSRQARDITEAWIKCYKKLQRAGYAPNLHILDNEFSSIMHEAFAKYKVQYQTVAPYKHRVNAAERAIQTFKDHFTAGLASCDPEFPAKEWDRLLTQAELTLLLMRSSRQHPHLSAYDEIYGKFDFNSTPLAPPGTRAVVFEPAPKRTSFGYHGKEGWYVGPALHKYKHYTFYIPKTHREQETDTMKWMPVKTTIPTFTTAEYLQQTFADIVTILQDNPHLTEMNLKYGNETFNAWEHLSRLLNTATAQRKGNPVAVQRVPQEPTKPTKSHPTPGQRVQHPQPNDPLHYDTDTEDDEDEPPRAQTLKAQPAATDNPYKKIYNPRRRYATAALATLLTQPSPIQTLQWEQQIHTSFHIYAESGKRISYEKLIKGEHKERWNRSSANEFGRLMQGVGKHTRPPHECVAGTDTMRIIRKEGIPNGKPVTYGNFVCDHRPFKEEEWRTRLTVGGDKLTYEEDATAPASQMTEAKLLFNSVISDHRATGAKFATADIKNFYLNNDLKQYQYMKIHKSKIPEEIQNEYNTSQFEDENGYIYFEIRKGMYGLKEAGIVAWLALVQHMAKYGYEPMRLTTGMWRHKTRKTIFTLTVDDFGIKYASQDDLNHLLNALRDKYTITVDMTGSQYCGMTLDWNYEEEYVDVSMPNYVNEALHQLQHSKPSKPVHAPHKSRVVVYGRKSQKPTEDDKSPKLDKEGTKRIQRITGKFLFYARAVDHTMLVALNELGRQQANPTQATMEAANQLLDYAATHPDAKIRFHASDMVLHIDTDAAFLVQPQAKSRIAGYYFMGSKIIRNGLPETELNAPILVQCKTIRYTVSSAAEAEIGGVYDAGQTAVHLRQALEEMGHPQPPTPIKTDNATAQGILTATMRPKMSKSIDKNYWWMKDKIKQGEYNLYWKSGRENWADYHTKHHPPAHHKMMRKKYLVANAIQLMEELRGCVAHLGVGKYQFYQDSKMAHGTEVAQHWNVPMTYDLAK